MSINFICIHYILSPVLWDLWEDFAVLLLFHKESHRISKDPSRSSGLFVMQLWWPGVRCAFGCWWISEQTHQGKKLQYSKEFWYECFELLIYVTVGVFSLLIQYNLNLEVVTYTNRCTCCLVKQTFRHRHYDSNIPLENSVQEGKAQWS